MAKKRSVSKKMAETMILAKLYKDGVIVVDTAHKKVTIDARRGELIQRYQKESYEDIKSILDRTAIGLGIQGYDVKVIRLELVEATLAEAEALEDIVEKISDKLEN